jgi:hypothetical protein
MGKTSKSFGQGGFALLVILLAQPCWLPAQQAPFNATAHVTGEPVANATMAESFPATPFASGANALPTASFRPASTGAIAPVVRITIPDPSDKPALHPFWDRENRTLFALNATMAGADFYTTRRNLARNGTELNPVTRLFSGSTPGLAANFAMETGGVIGVSYMLHKTGHHKLERMTSYVNLGASAFAVSYGLAHH